MSKIIIWLTLLLTFNSYSKSTQYLNPQSFLDAAQELPDGPKGISYYHVVPQFEQNPDPERQVVLEFYFGEYDGSEESKQQIAWVKKLIEEEKNSGTKFDMETLVTGHNENGLESSERIEEMLRAFDAKNVVYDEMPRGVLTGENTKSREPSSVKNFVKDPRNYWTFIRGASGAAGVFAGLVLADGVSPGVAAAVATVPGLISGGITYHMGVFGRWLTSGKWVEHLLTSEGIVAKNLRKGLGITPARFADSIKKNKVELMKKYPLMHQQSPEAVSMLADMKSHNSFKKVITRMRTFEEYVKWWVTEVAFTGLAFKAPQVMAGLSEVGSIAAMTGDVLVGATMGFAAQGPGDIAIQLHKYKKFEKLKDDIQKGKHPNPSQEIVFNKERVTKTLLEEVEMVLSNTKDFESYNVTKYSHKALRGIENWSRAAATGLGFFSVVGVGLEIAGVPLARPLLLGVGVGGAAYFAQMKGWINLSVPERVKEAYAPFAQSLSNLSMQSLLTRYCQQSFLPRTN
ncbi:MAG: hypothetical protein KC478_07470 [Bacteriovoracaceae bacterium]|nr:hypothetical protein [Bacteriovoracaceae bacterium]